MRSAQLAVKLRVVTILCAALGTVTSAYLASSSQVAWKTRKMIEGTVASTYLASSSQVARETRKLIVPLAICKESFFYRVLIIDRLNSNRMVLSVARAYRSLIVKLPTQVELTLFSPRNNDNGDNNNNNNTPHQNKSTSRQLIFSIQPNFNPIGWFMQKNKLCWVVPSSGQLDLSRM